MQVAETVQDVFMNTCMRTCTNTDVLGVELCGAMKNIEALAVGISSGLGNGDNARAALITRGIAEISRLGLKMGCAEYTFGGLAGIGDLIVTATSMHSRNNRCGILIGQGVPPQEAVRQVGTVEGINALPAAMQLMERYQVEMPIAKAVNAVVKGEISAKDMDKHAGIVCSCHQLNRAKGSREELPCVPPINTRNSIECHQLNREKGVERVEDPSRVQGRALPESRGRASGASPEETDASTGNPAEVLWA